METQPLETRIEPQWAGSERSVQNVVVWSVILLVIIPTITSIILSLVIFLFSGYVIDQLITYALSIIFVSIPTLSYLDKENKLVLKIEGDEAVIITDGLPSNKEEEQRDSQEISPLNGCKLGEGRHILGPFDLIYARIATGVVCQVKIPGWRVTVGEDRAKDLVISDSVADVRLDSQHLYTLARIHPTNEDERNKRIENRMIPLVRRITEEIVVEVMSMDPPVEAGRRTEVIQEKVIEEIKERFKARPPGYLLNSLELGDANKPERVENARDNAAAVEEIAHASEHIIKLNDNPNIPEGGRITVQEALDQALVASGIRKSEDKRSTLKFDGDTIKAVGDLVKAFIQLLQK
ncbi:MAG: hypothetical protein RLZZ517_231 [Candidatus Parcubacteria bacterium]|jgi:hypothetical protein